MNAAFQKIRPRPWRMAMPLAAALLLQFCGGDVWAQNLLQNPGFESGTTGWFGWGPVSLASSTAQPRTGSRSALVSFPCASALAA